MNQLTLILLSINRINLKPNPLSKCFQLSRMTVNKSLLLRIFGLLTSSLLLYSQRFGRYVLRPSSGFSYQTRKSIQNLELNPFIWTTGVDRSNSVNHDRIQVLSYCKYSLSVLPFVGIEPATSRWFHSEALSNQMPYQLHHESLLIDRL